jgi:hypothetical protein
MGFEQVPDRRERIEPLEEPRGKPLRKDPVPDPDFEPKEEPKEQPVEPSRRRETKEPAHAGVRTD